MQNKRLDNLLLQLEAIEANLQIAADSMKPLIRSVHTENRLSAQNLVHYLFLRSHDLRNLQEQLHDVGLSSLASAESHIYRQIQEIMQRLGKTIGKPSPLDATRGRQKLRSNATALFGKPRYPNIPSMMITYDKVMLKDPDSIRNLILSGMQVARINCAHDGPKTWLKMIQVTRELSRKLHKPVKIYMDLAGPKIRTTLYAKGKKVRRINLEVGDVVWLSETPADLERYARVIGCTLPGALSGLRPGDRIFFDDGKVAAKVEETHTVGSKILITRVTGKQQLKSEKGINIPDTPIQTASLTHEDLKHLPFIAKHADLVGYSFVRHASDIRTLRRALRKYNMENLPVVIKVETADAVRNLPALLFESMRNEHCAVMIARGDLALEISFERMSEIQDEILWICESAHIPVIWATQVLESLNKSGLATRSEITDATHSFFAECVMLNKGDHIYEVMVSLQNILERTGGHRLKKRYIFRPLSIAEHFFNPAQPIEN